MTGKVPVKDMDNLGIGLKLDADEGRDDFGHLCSLDLASQFTKFLTKT